MNALNLNTTLVDNYFNLLKNLSAENKEALVARLNKSLNKEAPLPAQPTLPYYEDFISEKSADEIIEELKKSRTLNTDRDSL